MPILLLLVVALVAGSLGALVAWRAPRAGTSTRAAVAEVADAASRRPRLRVWLQARRDPDAATGLALTVAFLAVVVGGIVIAVLAYLVRSHDALVRLDSGIARWGSAHATHTTQHLLNLVTDLGDTPAVVVIGLVVAVIETRRAPSRVIAPFLLLVTIGDKLATTAIKDLANRARPTFNPVAATLGPSFPSGHSSTAAAFYAAVALLVGRRRGHGARALIAGCAVGIAVAVASSRVLLDVHWLSDVIAGLLLGWAWFALCAIAFGGRLLRFGASAEIAAAEARAAPETRRAPGARP